MSDRHLYEPDDNGLVTGLARNVTWALEKTRSQLLTGLSYSVRTAARVSGGVLDRTDDVLAYMDPGVWLEDIYEAAGIASRERLDRLDDRIDRVELKLEDVARQRAREELMLLKQRVGELEVVLSNVHPSARAETREAMGALLSRLSELESRIDSMPDRRIEAAGLV